MKINCAAVVCINRNHVIGNGGSLLYNIPEDMVNFKNITFGSEVIVGRKTYEAIMNGLPGRNVIVMTRNKEYKIEGHENAQIATSKREALQLLKEKHCQSFYVIGGEQIYDLFESWYNKLFITYVDDFKKGDRFFNIDLTKYIKTREEEGMYEDIRFYFQEYVIRKDKKIIY